MPWRIQAFLDKTLQVALNDEQPGSFDPKTPADVHPIATTNENADSSPSSSSRQSKPSDAGTSLSWSSSSSMFLTADTKQYTATSSSSSLALPPPVVSAAMSRSTTAVSSEEAGPSSSTWPAMAATDESSSFSPHTHFEVAQDDKNSVSLLPHPTGPQGLAQGKTDHALGELGRSSPRPSLPPPCCPRCRHQTHADGPKGDFIQVFTSLTPTLVPWLHEPILAVFCIDCSISFKDAPIYSVAKTKSVVVDNGCSDSTIEHDSSSSSNPVSSSVAASSHRRAITYPVTSGLEARVNQSLLPAHQVAEDFAQLSFPQRASRRSASMQAPPTYQQTYKEESTLFLDDELQPFYN